LTNIKYTYKAIIISPKNILIILRESYRTYIYNYKFIKFRFEFLNKV
jgi:hypothetical protein